MNKAFVVSAKNAEASVIVWTDTASIAKLIGRRSEWLCGEDWRDLTARHEPTLVGERAAGYCAEGDAPDDQRLMRGLGWFELEGGGVPCKKCDRYSWDNVPESWLDESDVCAECREGEK